MSLSKFEPIIFSIPYSSSIPWPCSPSEPTDFPSILPSVANPPLKDKSKSIVKVSKAFVKSTVSIPESVCVVPTRVPP